MARLAESPQVGSDLDQDRAGAADVDARNRLQEPQGALVVGQCGLDADVECGQGGVGPVDGLQLDLQREQRERVERGGERLGQWRELRSYMACEPGKDAPRRVLGDQSVEHPPPIDAEQVRQDAADPETVMVERLVDAIACPTAFGNEPATIAGQLAQLPEQTRRNVARQGEAELADAGQPEAVVGIGLLSADLPDVLGMEQVGADAGLFERLETEPSSRPRCPPSLRR